MRVSKQRIIANLDRVGVLEQEAVIVRLNCFCRSTFEDESCSFKSLAILPCENACPLRRENLGLDSRNGDRVVKLVAELAACAFSRLQEVQNCVAHAVTLVNSLAQLSVGVEALLPRNLSARLIAAHFLYLFLKDCLQKFRF